VITFTVHPKAAVTHFKNDNSIVVDVKGAFVEAKKEEPKPAPKAEEKKEPPKEEPKEEPKKEQPTSSEAVPAVSEKEGTKPEERPVVKVSGPVAPTPKAAPTEPVKTVAAPQIESTWPPRLQNPMNEADVIKIRKIVAEKEAAPIAVFDPKIVVGAVVFERAGYVTILFDRKLSDDAFPDLKDARVKLIPFTLADNSGYRIRVPENVGVRATRTDTAWKVYLVDGTTTPFLTTEFISQPQYALGARMLIPSANPPKPVKIKDPVVGDELLLMPFQETGAFTVKRRLSDFQIVPSAQGLVIKPWHERVVARVVTDGVEISSEGGLKLSSPEDMGVLPATIRGEEGIQTSLFDFKRWLGRDDESFTQKEQRLWQTIINVDKDERVLARMDLARLYFAHGFGYEALSVLEVVEKDLPDIKLHAEFLTLRGVSRILVGRVREGLLDLSSDLVKPEPDILLWRAVGAALLQKWDEAVPLFEKVMPLLAAYPEPMRSRFWILAIESAAALDETKNVVTWLATLEKEGFSDGARPAVSYLRAVLHSKAGKVDLAEKLWQQVAESDDHLYKVRAELALVDLGIATQSMTPEQATEKLEGLRFSWRGDGLELDILKRLGTFYVASMEYRKGFTTLFEAVNLFPDAPQTQELRRSMIKTFQDLFLTALGKDLSPLESLSLYVDFPSLVPAGVDGNAVRSNLAERLVDIDLLDQAVDLLKDLYVHGSTKEERVNTALRIVGIRLLDHNADLALKTLEEAKKETFELSKTTENEWRLLYARALSMKGQYQDALDALPQNKERSTLLLYADMALRAKQWGDAIHALQDLIGPAMGKELSEEQASWLVHLAVAMAHNQDSLGLDRLAIDFGDAMDKTSKASVFRVLTRPDHVNQLKDIQAAQAGLSEVDMFREVLDTYRKGRSK